MKKIFNLKILLFLLLSIYQTSYAGEITEYPNWINELKLHVDKTMQVESTVSNINKQDFFRKEKYFTFCIEGRGRLEKVPHPFGTMEKIFSSNGWAMNPMLVADKHGSSLFVYEKENQVCNISLSVDSDCRDEEDGHVPSIFWFEIFCREE